MHTIIKSTVLYTEFVSFERVKKSICILSPSDCAAMSRWTKWFVPVVVCHLQTLMNASKMSAHTTERAPTTWEAFNVNARQDSSPTWASDRFAKVRTQRCSASQERDGPSLLKIFCHLLSDVHVFTVPLTFPSADVDECYNSTVCGPESECHNTLGSYTCTCKVGYAATNREVEPSQSNICIGACFMRLQIYCSSHNSEKIFKR